MIKRYYGNWLVFYLNITKSRSFFTEQSSNGLSQYFSLRIFCYKSWFESVVCFSTECGTASYCTSLPCFNSLVFEWDCPVSCCILVTCCSSSLLRWLWVVVAHLVLVHPFCCSIHILSQYFLHVLHQFLFIWFTLSLALSLALTTEDQDYQVRH